MGRRKAKIETRNSKSEDEAGKSKSEKQIPRRPETGLCRDDNAPQPNPKRKAPAAFVPRACGMPAAREAKRDPSAGRITRLRIAAPLRRTWTAGLRVSLLRAEDF